MLWRKGDREIGREREGERYQPISFDIHSHALFSSCLLIMKLNLNRQLIPLHIPEAQHISEIQK